MTATTSTPDLDARYRQQSLVDRVRTHPAGPIAIVFVVMLVLCVLYALANPTSFFFLTKGNASLVLRAIPNLGIIALGVGLLMIAGEFDLSVGSVYVAAPFFMGLAYVNGVPLAFAIMFAFGIAIAIGLTNAFITLRFNIPSFITTLGMLFIVRTGAPYLAGHARSMVVKFPPEFKAALTQNIGGIMPAQFLWFIGFAVVAYLLLNRHFLGNHFYAAGGDKRAARFAGINVVWTKTIAFVLSSVFATSAGILQVARSSKADTNPQLFIELFAVVICVMGGLSLFGGRGAVIGIVLGATVLQLVQDVIILARLPGFYLDMFVGMAIVFGVVMNMAVQKRY